MEAFHKIKIKCPYEILEIEEIKIKNKPNEHGYTYIKGIVDDSINFKYAIEASTEDKICIYEETENEEESVIFNGTIQNININNNIDGIYHIEIEAYTSSFDLDIEEKSRSFQDIEMSYDDFLNIIMADFQMYDYTQCMNKPESIGFPRFQYKESSYKMIVRTASYLGINVYCDIINPSNAFYFGKPSGREYELEDDIDYTATLDINKYRESLVHNPDSHPTDFFYYEIKTPKVMQIGDKVTFKQKKFYIYSYEAEYVRGELIYTYRLCREKGIWQDKIYNDKLKGISLEGTVLEVSGEQVKLHLNIDENQDQAKAAWFRYAPPTGNIMYSMPIVGTSANLYFPNERNEEPIVIGCVRKNGSSCEKFSDVNNRYFSTESGNNLDMLPDAINFSRPGLSANFNDGSGITLSSSSSLSINAGYVGMFAGNVSIKGTRKLVAEKGASIISLENDFYNSAGIVKENGSDRASNEPFDDDPQKGAKEAETAMEMMMNDSALVAANDGSIGTIVDLRDLSNKPWAQPEDVDSLSEYKTGMQVPDGTRMRSVGLDGQSYPGTVRSTKAGTIFVPDNAEAYKNANSVNWNYIKTLGLSYADMIVEGGIGALKIPSKMNIAFSGNEERKKESVQQSRENIEYLEGLQNKVNAKFKEWAPYSDETFDSMQVLIAMTQAGRQIHGTLSTIGRTSSRRKSGLPAISNKDKIYPKEFGRGNSIIINKGSNSSSALKGNSVKGLPEASQGSSESSNLKPGVKVTNQSESSVPGDIDELIKASESGNKAKSSLEPRLQKYVCDLFEGVGKEAQDNFNKYLRENVWCNQTLSNSEKIDIMKANFDKLTPEQKINFNVSNEERVLRNPDHSDWGDWPDIAWPKFPGLNKDTAKSVYNEVTGEIEIPSDLDRLGSPYGNNLGAVKDGYHCTQDERSICYIENEYARNSYKFDGTYYKDAIDAIKDFDINNTEESVNKLNLIIDKLNVKNGTFNTYISENNVADWYSQYKAFQSKPELVDLCKEKGIDSTYGVMGEAASWVVNGELITSGGAEQINTPINVKALEELGILQNIGGW